MYWRLLAQILSETCKAKAVAGQRIPNQITHERKKKISCLPFRGILLQKRLIIQMPVRGAIK